MVSPGSRVQQGRASSHFRDFFLKKNSAYSYPPHCTDCNTLSHRHQVRPICHIPSRRAGGDHETGSSNFFFLSFFFLFQCPMASTQVKCSPQAKRFARAMHASLVFCSTSASINVQKIFKIVLAKAFDLKCVIPEIEGVGEPILIYVDV